MKTLFLNFSILLFAATYAVAEDDVDISFLDESNSGFEQALDKVEQEFKESAKREGKAIKYAKAQKTAGLLKSAAAKSKAQQANQALTAIKQKLTIIEDKLNQSNQSIKRMENELGKVDLS